MSSPPDSTLASLTFDDGPDPVWTPRVLDVLSRTDTKATFFVIAPLAMEYPHLIERTVSEGHEVAFHCDRHVRHTELSEAEILSNTRHGLEDLATLGVEPSLWRPPWGIVTDGTERVADEFGLRLARWTVDTHDWRGDPSEKMLREVESDLGGGAIVLMHDGLGPGATRDGCEETLALIPLLVETLRRDGLRTATVSELLPRETSVGG